MINYFLKDEAPKAPVYIYSINNQNKFDLENLGDDVDDDDIINLEKMRELGALNKCLFFSEFEENVDLVVPFDTVDIGKGVKKYFGKYNSSSLF